MNLFLSIEFLCIYLHIVCISSLTLLRYITSFLYLTNSSFPHKAITSFLHLSISSFPHKAISISLFLSVKVFLYIYLLSPPSLHPSIEFSISFIFSVSLLRSLSAYIYISVYFPLSSSIFQFEKTLCPVSGA